MIRRAPSTENGSAEDRDIVAADWVSRVDAGDLGQDARERLDAWLGADSRNHGAFVRANAGMRLLDGLAATRTEDQSNLELRRPLARRTFLGFGAAAAAAAVGGVIWNLEDKRVQSFSTQAGEVRRLNFANGAELTMDSRSKIRSVVSQGAQRISLDTGRVWFDTRQNDRAPLIVNAGELRLESERASFSAARTGERVDLLVVEGSVDALNDSRRSAPLTFEKGAQATLMQASLVRTANLSPEALMRAQAWRSGHIALDGETVAEVVTTFNQHNQVQIVLRTARLSQERLFGYFYLNDPVSFAAALEQTFDARVRRERDNLIVE